MSPIPMPDIVVLLPGITGSTLSRNGTPIWAPEPEAIVKALVTLGGSVDALTLREDDWRVDDLGDGIVADGLMPDIHTLPGLWKIDGYSAVQTFLKTEFDLVEGRNFFPFPYDWRRDNRASARRLADLSKAWLRDWRQSSGHQDAQLVLVGHSMGGLVARYFVEALEGWQDTRAVVTFGTPFYGSLNAVDFLVNGFRKGIGPFTKDLTGMLRSLTSLHQMVPLYRCVYRDTDDQQALTPAAAGLPGWDAAWSDHLTVFQDEIERAAAANRRDPAWETNPVIYHPIVGIDQPTRQGARLAEGRLVVELVRGGSDEGGDGTVPKLSAALSGTEDARTFVPQRHASLQNEDGMLHHLKGILQSLHDVRVSDLRDAAQAWFGYLGDDLYLPDEEAVVGITLESALGESQLPQLDALVTITPHTAAAPSATPPRTIPVTLTRRPAHVPLGPLPAGAYDITVTADGAAPLRDVFLVAAAADLAD
ncbi:lipase/acyltransferase domain-containing protein [Kitasatospora cinereorecta]|uniref:Lecithin:cholesterol acyltransferase n=1 Tax=Kitasatospora cinereorecta TaxID=285560 RepID=A0ABW0VEZ0_9ACTN